MTIARNVTGYEILQLDQRGPGVYYSWPFTLGAADATMPKGVGVGDVLLMVNLTASSGEPVISVHLEGSNIANPATLDDMAWTDRTAVRGAADHLPLRNTTVPFARVHAIDGRFKVTVAARDGRPGKPNPWAMFSLTALVFTDQS